MNYWLVKSEPAAYSFSDLVADKKTAWTGVRNFLARNNLRAMKRADRVLFYHSVTDKSVVGIAEVAKEAYPDPTAREGDWYCVDIKALSPLKSPVTLECIKSTPSLKNILLIRQSRLSVMPLEKKDFETIVHLAERQAPKNQRTRD